MFKLGKTSIAELQGVNTKLIEVCLLAIADPALTVDFAVHDGLRTLIEQQAYLASGVSQTLDSKHLVQLDGTGHAVDLVPYVNGKLRWEWAPIYQVAGAVHRAAAQLKVPLTWGGCWDRPFLGLDPLALEAAVEAYAARRRVVGRKAFLDGPHWQLL